MIQDPLTITYEIRPLQRREKAEEGLTAEEGPHHHFSYPLDEDGGAAVLRDVSDLLIHHVKRQGSIRLDFLPLLSHAPTVDSKSPFKSTKNFVLHECRERRRHEQ